MSEMGGIEVATFEVTLTEIVGEHQIPCDFAETFYDCQAAPAQWIARRVVCVCGQAGARLICTQCKDILMMSDDAIQCRTEGCDEVYQPARTIVSSIEAL